MKISTSQYPQLVSLMKKIYPDYKGRKFFLEVFDKSFDTTSYWDGGSRTYYKFVKSDGNVLSLPETHPFIQHTKENREAQLIPGLVCIKHTFFCGHDCGLTIIFHPVDMPKQLTKD
jgi:hypothetical protein